jgi:hypothetical protein
VKFSPQRRIQSRRVAAHDKRHVEIGASKSLELRPLRGLLEDSDNSFIPGLERRIRRQRVASRVAYWAVPTQGRTMDDGGV